MSETWSVKERIERRVAAILAAAQTASSTGWIAVEQAAGRMTAAQAGRCGVHRFDHHGRRLSQDDFTLADLADDMLRQGYGHGDVIVASDDESADESDQASYGLTAKRMPLTVVVLLAPPESSTENSAVALNRWLARLETALCSSAGGNVAEGDGTVVAWRIQCTGTRRAELSAGGKSGGGGGTFCAAVDFAVDYRHPRSDPYTPR